jgi:hypothetical protein
MQKKFIFFLSGRFMNKWMGWISVLLLVGCGKTFIVQERSGMELKMERVQESTRLHILVGETEQTIPLKHIEKLQILSEYSRVFKGKVYYGCNILFRDGTYWHHNVRPGSAEYQKGVTARVYALANDVLRGKVRGESIDLTLSDIRMLYLMPPPAKKVEAPAPEAL